MKAIDQIDKIREHIKSESGKGIECIRKNVGIHVARIVYYEQDDSYFVDVGSGYRRFNSLEGACEYYDKIK
jgi:prefoldin subunit 5